MAKEALKKLEEQLNCSICLDTYTDPKLLQCFHVYCRKCLVPLVDRDQEGQLGLYCPTCRRVTPIPDRGVAGLQPAFHINHLLELQETFQKVENPAATLQGTVPTSVSLVKKTKYCLVHEGKELELFCETCGELICYKCVVKDGNHRNHDFEELDQAFQKYKQEITSSLEPLEKQVVTVKKTLKQLDAHCKIISGQRTATADNVHSTFTLLREVLTARETELIGLLDEITARKLKDLASQKEVIETRLAQLNSCLYFMRESLRSGCEDDVLLMKRSTLNQAVELATPIQFQIDVSKPSTEAFVSLDLISACQNHGRILSPALPDPLKCNIKAEIAAVVGETSTVVLQALNFEGMPCSAPIRGLECEVFAESTGTSARCDVEKEQSRYKISYQPTTKGRHQLHVKIDDQHVQGSPHVFPVLQKLLGISIFTIGERMHPWGVAIGQNGEVILAEEGGHCVSVFGCDGEQIRSFGMLGSRPGEFQNPRGVAVDGEGNILVTDSWNHRVQKFTNEGQFLTAVGTKGDKPQQFHNPCGIAYSASNNRVYVSEQNNHRIQVLNSNLTFFSTFGEYGSGEGQFSSPHGVACDSTGKVYVVDTCNDRIQVFTAEGVFLGIFGSYGQGRGEVKNPVGIAIDNYISITENSNHCVSMFTPEGQYVTSFGKWGKGPGELKSPCGLAVDKQGITYVCDQSTHRVELFPLV